MKIFFDTANIDELRMGVDAGILDGCTTNPSLIKAEVKKGLDLETHIEEICRTVGKGRSVSLEVVSTDYDNMRKEGLLLYERFNPIAGNVFVKVPVNTSLDGKNIYDGLRTIKELSQKGIPVNATLIMTPHQALLAAKAGARIVSPFAGRIDDHIRTSAKVAFGKDDYFPAEGIKKDDDGIVSGVDLIRKTALIFRTHGMKCEILAASIRNARQVSEVAQAGANIASIPYKVAQGMLAHPKTSEGVVKFSQDTVEEYRNVFRK